jgi:hypothetical protein
MTEKAQPERGQHTAPESMPEPAASSSGDSASVAVVGASSGAAAGITGDDAETGLVGGADAYPADGVSPDRGSSAKAAKD